MVFGMGFLCLGGLLVRRIGTHALEFVDESGPVKRPRASAARVLLPLAAFMARADERRFDARQGAGEMM